MTSSTVATRFSAEGFQELFTAYAADIYPGRYTPEYCAQLAGLAERALELLQQKRALLLVHNYQFPELQEIAREAGYIGDSYGLTMQAKQTDYPVIVFCSVEFMAKTAKVLLPDRRVLIPDRPGCSLVASVSLNGILRWKEKHPDGKVVSYINTDDATKAESDYICTSRNAAAVVAHVRKAHPQSRILFLPDKYLAAHVARELALGPEEMDVWDGACHVHKRIGEQALEEAMELHPEAELLIHPECGCTSSCLARTSNGMGRKMAFLSTEGMIARARQSAAREFVVATESGIVYRLRREIPEKKFWPVSASACCEYMKMITLEKLVACLEQDRSPVFEVRIPPQIADRARTAIARMTEIA